MGPLTTTVDVSPQRLPKLRSKPMDSKQTDMDAMVGLTPEELKDETVRGIDDALSRPVLSRFLSAHAKRVMRAQRTYWMYASAAEKARYMDCYNKEPE